MQILSCETSPQGFVTVRFAADAAEYESYLQKVYLRERKNHKIEGFLNCPPREAIEAKKGKTVFWYDAFNLCIDEAFWPAWFEALEKKGLHPLLRPDFNLETVSEAGFTGTATAALLPAPLLNKTGDLKGTVTALPVSDFDVYKALYELRSQHMREVPSTDPLADGDLAVLDFEGTIEGHPFETGTDTGRRMIMNETQPFPGFYSELLGHRTGETVIVVSQFPHYMAIETLNGHVAWFKVTVRETFHRELPPADDAFARELGFESLADLEADLRRKLEEQSRAAARAQGLQALLAAFARRHVTELPAEAVESRMDTLYHQFKRRCVLQPISWREALRQMNTTEEEYCETLRGEARVQLSGTAALIRFAQNHLLTPIPAAHGALLCEGPEGEAWFTDGLTEGDRALVNAAVSYFEQQIAVQP